MLAVFTRIVSCSVIEDPARFLNSSHSLTAVMGLTASSKSSKDKFFITIDSENYMEIFPQLLSTEISSSISAIRFHQDPNLPIDEAIKQKLITDINAFLEKKFPVDLYLSGSLCFSFNLEYFKSVECYNLSGLETREYLEKYGNKISSLIKIQDTEQISDDLLDAVFKTVSKNPSKLNLNISKLESVPRPVMSKIFLNYSSRLSINEVTLNTDYCYINPETCKILAKSVKDTLNVSHDPSKFNYSFIKENCSKFSNPKNLTLTGISLDISKFSNLENLVLIGPFALETLNYLTKTSLNSVKLVDNFQSIFRLFQVSHLEIVNPKQHPVNLKEIMESGKVTNHLTVTCLPEQECPFDLEQLSEGSSSIGRNLKLTLPKAFLFKAENEQAIRSYENLLEGDTTADKLVEKWKRYRGITQ
jgi:hypothetical protein